MKRKKEWDKRDIYGRRLTKFGYCLYVVLLFITGVSFLVTLGLAGDYEQGADFSWCVAPSLAIFLVSAGLYIKIFE